MKVLKVPKFFRSGSKKSPSRDSISENSGSRSTSSVSSADGSAEFAEPQNFAHQSSVRETEEPSKVASPDVASTSRGAGRARIAARAGAPLDSAHDELVHAFEAIDQNKDGKISAEELGVVLKSLGEDMPEEYLRGMVDAADVNRDGHVDLEEFLELNKLAYEEVAWSGELRDTFSIFDLNKDQFISEDELHHVLTQLGQQWFTREDCTNMIKAVDADGDGRVDFGEFKRMMTGTLIL